MILQAVDLAEGRKVAPLRLLDQLRDWQANGLPPVHGGLNDQPAVLMHQGRYLQAVYRLMAAFYHDPNYRMNKDESTFFAKILKLVDEREKDRHARLG